MRFSTTEVLVRLKPHDRLGSFIGVLNNILLLTAVRNGDHLDTGSALTSDTDFSLTDVSQLDVSSSHQMVLCKCMRHAVLLNGN